jgi:glutathione S-transferase
MSAYRLFGAQTSPYSLKVRSFLRYKKLPFDWVERSGASQDEFATNAPTPSIPLLISPQNEASQDSTAILARLDALHPEPPGQPLDPGLAALSLLIEDYADEWVNKLMFHYRWSASPDREGAAERVLEQLMQGRKPKDRAGALRQIMERMGDRLPLVGADAVNAPVLKASFRRLVTLLNAHLQEHLCLFGGHPCIADFALAAQLSQMLADPTPAEILHSEGPFVTAWCEFMESPTAGAPFADLPALMPTLLPLLRDEVCAAWLPWAASNTQGTARRRKVTAVDLADGTFSQTTQRYAGLSFKAVKASLAKVKERSALDTLIEGAGARGYLE